jgi:hypothetical protein
VQAARVIGVPTRRILFKELLPNLIAPIIVSISLGLPAFVTPRRAWPTSASASPATRPGARRSTRP